MKNESAVVLLSGGLDSATTLYIAKEKKNRVVCLIFDYGQRHKKELSCARQIARSAGCPFKIVRIRLDWQGSSLLDRTLKIPGGTQRSKKTSKIPSTYVPARNTIFLSFALSYAEVLGARNIYIGANALDYSGYPDCRPAYYKAFRRLASLATKCGLEDKPIRIQTPLIHLTKAQIIKRGMKLGVPYQLTWSCYKGGKVPCGWCESCSLRAKGFREAGLRDPAIK